MEVLFSQQDTERPILQPVDGAQIVYFTRKSPDKDTENEDAILIWNKGSATLLALADGMGGHKNGSLASKTALESLLKTLNSELPLNIENLVFGVQQAHEEIKNLKVGAGTTLVLALIIDEIVHFINCGDSVGLQVSGKKNVKFKTVEQSPLGYAREAGLMTELEKQYHEENHLLLHAIGQDPLRLEVSGPLEFQPRDYILLYSDGISDNLVMEEVLEPLSISELEKSVETIAGMVHEKYAHGGKLDDVAFLLYTKA